MYCNQTVYSQVFNSKLCADFVLVTLIVLSCAIVIDLFLGSGVAQAFGVNATGASGGGTAVIGSEFKDIIVDKIYNSPLKTAIGVLVGCAAAYYVFQGMMSKFFLCLVGGIMFVKAPSIADTLGSVLI